MPALSPQFLSLRHSTIPWPVSLSSSNLLKALLELGSLVTTRPQQHDATNSTSRTQAPRESNSREPSSQSNNGNVRHNILRSEQEVRWSRKYKRKLPAIGTIRLVSGGGSHPIGDITTSPLQGPHRKQKHGVLNPERPFVGAVPTFPTPSKDRGVAPILSIKVPSGGTKSIQSTSSPRTGSVNEEKINPAQGETAPPLPAPSLSTDAVPRVNPLKIRTPQQLPLNHLVPLLPRKSPTIRLSSRASTSGSASSTIPSKRLQQRENKRVSDDHILLLENCGGTMLQSDIRRIFANHHALIEGWRLPGTDIVKG
ncbi:hypothetical protein ABW19_dt0200187 [Dactylella cylindrospora]|nr:hypothetical protein ABW19_dt0200187 [Dactylella cylindrospora]